MSDINIDRDLMQDRMEDTYACEGCITDLREEPVYCAKHDRILCRKCGKRHRDVLKCGPLSQPWNERDDGTHLKGWNVDV